MFSTGGLTLFFERAMMTESILITMESIVKKLFFALFLVLFFCPLQANAQLPDKNAYVYEWENYTHKILLELFPEEKELIDRLKFSISPEVEPNAFSSAEENSIEISRGAIELISNYESEYAYLVCHEFGHIKSKHHMFLPQEFATLNEFLEKRKKDELEADAVAEVAIGKSRFGHCAAYTFINKLAAHYQTLNNPSDPYYQTAVARVSRAETFCSGRHRED